MGNIRNGDPRRCSTSWLRRFHCFSATRAPVPPRYHERDSHGRHWLTQATPRQPDHAMSGVIEGP